MDFDQYRELQMDFDQYENDAPYPTKLNFVTKFWYTCGLCVARQDGGGEIVILEKGATLDKCVVESVTDQVGFQLSRERYNARAVVLQHKFKQDLFEELGIADNPRREKLFSKAWDDGHSAGYAEVFSCARDLVELIKD